MDNVFQSTPPRRGRREQFAGSDYLLSFNPRPRAGGDGRVRVQLPLFSQFQSTPPRRGRHT